MASSTDGTFSMSPRSGLILTTLWSLLVNWSSTETQRTTSKTLSNLLSPLDTSSLVWNLLWTKCSKVDFSLTLTLIVTDSELTTIKSPLTAHTELVFPTVNVMVPCASTETKDLSPIMSPQPSTNTSPSLKPSSALKESLVLLVRFTKNLAKRNVF